MTDNTITTNNGATDNFLEDQEGTIVISPKNARKKATAKRNGEAVHSVHGYTSSEMKAAKKRLEGLLNASGDIGSATPREKMLLKTACRLNALLDEFGLYNGGSKEIHETTANCAFCLMLDFEERALGKDGDRLIFCDPDQPVEFVAE